MLRTPQSTAFQATHQAASLHVTDVQASDLMAAVAAGRGHDRATRVTKRSPIWADGLSTAGGELPG